MTKQLHADLIRQTGAAGHRGTGTQRAGAIAQTGGRILAKAVRIHTRHLGSDVSTHAHQTAGELIGDLEGFPFQIPTCAVEQGLEKLDQRREYQFIAPLLIQIQCTAAQLFDCAGPAGENLFYPVGQQPLCFLIHSFTMFGC